LLQQGKQLLEENIDVLFPTQHKEYEIVYQGKKRKILLICPIFGTGNLI